MEIKFTKMHGCGNDYIYVNCFDGELPEPEKISAEMSPRHFSVGSDGLIMVCRSDVADAKMRMFNLDGSEGKMCGNGIRCVGKFVHDYGLSGKTELDIELSGIKHLSLHSERRKVKPSPSIWAKRRRGEKTSVSQIRKQSSTRPSPSAAGNTK